MSYRELENEQRRQLVDLYQVYEAWREADRARRHHFAGSMSWKRIRGHEYLYKKIAGRATSIGPRSEETERAYKAFQEGRGQIEERLRSMARRMPRMAAVNKALELGRVPRLTARILRRLDEAGILGRHVRVAGTNCLYAYEAAFGVHVGSDLLATGDVDLRDDARRCLRLFVPDIDRERVIGRLRRVDWSFQVSDRQKYRAANRGGFLVDLIAPVESRDSIRPRRRPDGPSVVAGDPVAAGIEGLPWHIGCPAFERTAVGEDGYPVWMVCPDPRAFALHKLWLSGHQDRDPLQRGRDRAQGALIVSLLRSRMPQLSFDSCDLHALPESLRRMADTVPEQVDFRENESSGLALKPNW